MINICLLLYFFLFTDHQTVLVSNSLRIVLFCFDPYICYFSGDQSEIYWDVKGGTLIENALIFPSVS